MSGDNVILNPGAGGDTIAADDLGTLNGSPVTGVKAQRVKIGFGADGDFNDASASNPLPVALDAASLAALESVTVQSSALPAGAATEITLAAINTDIGAPNDAAASSDAGTFSLIALFKRLLSKTSALLTTTPSQDAAASPVRLVGQDVITAGFSSVGSSVLDNAFNAPVVGTGVGYSQAGGALLITTGTSTNAEFLTRSTRAVRGSHRLRFTLTASQRIGNQNLAVLMADLVGEGLSFTIVSATVVDVGIPSHTFTAQNVGQFCMLGGIVGAAGVPGRYAIASIPDANTVRFTVAGWPGSGSGTLTVFGRNYIRTLITGTTATNAAVDAQRNGWATGDTTATINTTASPGTLIQAELTGREVFFSDALRASSTTPTFATRASRYENIPDSTTDFYLFLWSYNGTSAPASTTTWTLGHASVESFPNVPVYLQGMRSQGAANPMPVAVQNSPTVGVTGYPTAAASADGLANPTVTKIDATGLLFNGTTWDRARGNTIVTMGDTGAKTATFNGATQTNHNARGAYITLAVGTVSGTTPTLSVQLQVSYDGTNFVNLGPASANLTATGTVLIAIYPSNLSQAAGVTPANLSNGATQSVFINAPLPRTWRLVYTIGGTTPSFTFTNAYAAYVL